MNTYFWELVPKELAWFPLGSGIGVILAFVLIRRLHENFDKRGTAARSLNLLTFFATAPVVGRVLGWLPSNDQSPLLPMPVFFSGAAYCTFAVLNISVMSMLADIADQHELASGDRREGIFYSARTFFSKATTALGTLVDGIAIDVIGVVGSEPSARVKTNRRLRLVPAIDSGTWL